MHSQAHSGTGQMPTPRVCQEQDHECGTAKAERRRDASHVITQPMGAYSLYYGHWQGMHIRPTMTSLIRLLSARSLSHCGWAAQGGKEALMNNANALNRGLIDVVRSNLRRG